MNKLKIIVSIVCVVLFGIYIYAIVKSPLPYEVIDRDQSNFISLVEVIDSRDISKREIIADDIECLEFYWLKDGFLAHLECD